MGAKEQFLFCGHLSFFLELWRQKQKTRYLLVTKGNKKIKFQKKGTQGSRRNCFVFLTKMNDNKEVENSKRVLLVSSDLGDEIFRLNKKKERGKIDLQKVSLDTICKFFLLYHKYKRKQSY